MSFFRNLAGVLLTSAVGFPIGMLTSIVLARLLSTDDRGFYAVATSFATVTTMLTQFGWPTAAIDRLRRGGRPPAEVSGGSLVFLGLVSLLVVALALLGQAPLREHLLSDLPFVVFFAALVTVPLRMLANGFGSVARGINRFQDENWFGFALRVANLVAAFVVLAWLGGALTSLMWATAIVYAVLVLGLIVVVVRRTGLQLALPAEEMMLSLRFGLKTHAMTVAGRLHERLDIFMLAALLAEPTQIAFYAIAKGIIQIIQTLPSSFGKVAYPELAGLPPRAASEFAAGLVRQNLLLLAPIGIVLGVSAPILLPLLYGKPYAASTVPFLLLLPGTLLQGAAGVLARYFTGTDNHRPNIATRFISLGVNAALNYLWIPRFGVSGAAAAAAVSYTLDAVLVVVIFLAQSDCRFGDLVRVRSSDLDPYRKLLRRTAKAWRRRG